MTIMKDEMLKRKFIYIKILAFILMAVCLSAKPLTVKADGIPIHIIDSVPFADHNGMEASIKGKYVYCTQRGYPFRSKVSELQMVNIEDLEFNGTIAANIRYLLRKHTGSDNEYFRGWSEWTLNGDHTDATQTSTEGAPASSAWQEVFDEDMEDTEDSPYENRYTGTGSIIQFSQQVLPLITGHEGAIEPFSTTMKEISHTEAGFSMPQVYAMAITNYYCFEDPDAGSYSERIKYMVKQALDWGTEFNFITTVGGNGYSLRILYKDSTGTYGIHGANSYSGSCDGYIKTTLSDYASLKLYRQVVWKTVNMRAIPSFAEKEPVNCKPIKLYWDEDQHLYTTTVSDANGVLDYFDFSILGVNCTNNGDGTLTLSVPNALGGILTSSAARSQLEPSDGVFKLPEFYRWDLEGKEVTFKYTVFVKDLETQGYDHFFRENGSGRMEAYDYKYRHSHGFVPACNWFCTIKEDALTHCTETFNDCHSIPYNDCSHSCNNDCAGGSLTCTDTSATHTHGDSCYSSKYCGHEHTADCHKCTLEDCHDHEYKCYHKSTCTYLANKGGNEYCNAIPAWDCNRVWCCGKEHFNTKMKEITGTYIDWQDVSGVYAKGRKLIDPELCYIKVETVGHEFPAETDTEILLIANNDEWNDLTYTMPNGQTVKHSSHLRVGEKFHLKYIYSYTGASKGFRIETSINNKPYYQYTYLARMQAPENTIPIYNLRSGLSGDRFSKGSIGVPHARLVIDETPVTIKGVYTTPETAYTINGAYTYNSGDNWNDNIYLDALTTDQYDDWYSNKSADDYNGHGEKITTSNTSDEQTSFTVTKQDDRMQAVWVYDTEPEVFTSALVYATAYIQVGEDTNHTRNYYDEAYNYAADETWAWGFEPHNNVGGVGYFSSEYTDPNGTQSDNLIPSHTVYTQNNEYLTYAIRNKVWQSDVDIKVSNFVQNTGAGITEHIYRGRDANRSIDNHDMNYNLYYTIDVENPKATIYADKQRAHDGQNESDSSTTPYNTASDVYEFDVNNMVSWGSTGASQPEAGGSYGNIAVVDHIKTGTTYIQREIPTVLNTLTGNQKETMTFSIYPNYDRLVYEDHFTSDSVRVEGSGTNRKVKVSAKDGYYPPNEQSYTSDIYPAINPNMEDMRPQNINGSNNVPDQYNQDDNVLHHMSPTTSFNIKLSNGETKTIVDSHTKTYTQYDFEYNGGNRNNKVTFPSRRKSIMFFKYSKTNYSYDGKSVQSAVGEFKNAEKTQTESYYISQVLFKSNYTSKYKKELEAQGADYIEETDVYGNLTDAWIDMVNQNKFAIVSAGQGFEIKVTVKYENSFLTQYLARYCGADDAQNDILGTSNRVQKRYNDVPANSRQYANISALTGKDGRTAPCYKNTARAYISSYSILDRLAVNLVTGSNVFKDLYCFMSDNPDTVYSYSGIYDTPVVFERDIEYSSDFSITTITYTMCVSHENGISSNLQKMKFYTNQLAPDKKTPGIVEGMYDVSTQGEHSITIWTPIVAATPFDYPNAMQDRYIGDAIELGYTIRTTGADDSIVHIVQ